MLALVTLALSALAVAMPQSSGGDPVADRCKVTSWTEKYCNGTINHGPYIAPKGDEAYICVDVSDSAALLLSDECKGLYFTQYPATGCAGDAAFNGSFSATCHNFDVPVGSVRIHET